MPKHPANSAPSTSPKVRSSFASACAASPLAALPRAAAPPSSITQARPSIELELMPPRFIMRALRLIGLCQQVIAHHQVVHLGAHETPICVLGRAHDRLAANVEGSVDDHPASGERFEAANQLVIARIGLAMDC